MTGSRETWESLPLPNDNPGEYGRPGDQTSELSDTTGLVDSTQRRKVCRYRSCIYKETKRYSKGGGSLSIFIVPLESREIRPGKAGE